MHGSRVGRGQTQARPRPGLRCLGHGRPHVRQIFVCVVLSICWYIKPHNLDFSSTENIKVWHFLLQFRLKRVQITDSFLPKPDKVCFQCGRVVDYS